MGTGGGDGDGDGGDMLCCTCCGALHNSIFLFLLDGDV